VLVSQPLKNPVAESAAPQVGQPASLELISGGCSTVPGVLVDDALDVGIAFSGSGDAVTVSPRGEVDYTAAPVFRSALLRCLRAPITQVIVDLSDVTFVNSPGLLVLAEANRLAHRDGISLVVRGHRHRAVRRPLQMVGLWGQLTHAQD
jgi:anti-sigma B factor antagonist